MANQHASARSSSGFVAGILVGLISTCLVGGMIFGIVGYAMGSKLVQKYRRGWNLVPVVVAAQDIPAGTVVTFDMVSQRSLPEQFVTKLEVKPDSASYIVNQPLLHGLQAGDPLRWTDFNATTPKATPP